MWVWVRMLEGEDLSVGKSVADGGRMYKDVDVDECDGKSLAHPRPHSTTTHTLTHTHTFTHAVVLSYTHKINFIFI
jgi:hypothetical protein